MKNIAIFASGEGTNAQKIFDYFKDSSQIRVSLVVSNKEQAPVLERARRNNIPTLILNKSMFYETESIVDQLQSKEIDLIVLAGFLWQIPLNLISAFNNKIINIHPALLPEFGGKGMYGMKVHQAVIDGNETESGITIHYVDAQYDTGKIIVQKKCLVERGETPETLAEKIHQLEHEFYPQVIETLLIKKDSYQLEK